jgi:arylsulfatase A-like enzyme
VKTNLVVLFTDEQSINTLGVYGNTLVQTPNIDALAANSVVFDRAYVTQPVCTASRSSILSGLYPHTNGCTENNISLASTVRAFPELLPKNQYQCGYVGKWHLGDEIFPQHGFEDWISIEDAYHAYYSDSRDSGARSSYDAFLRSHGYQPDQVSEDGIGYFSRPFAARLPEEHTKAQFVGNESIDFIERNREQPFVLFANFLEPHMPFFGPRDEQYLDVDVPLPVSFGDSLKDKALKTRLFSNGYARNGHSGIDLSSEPGWKQLIRQYWGLVAMIDSQIGRILASIDSCGVADRTVVVFTSDHGDMMGAHSLVGKCVMFEEAVRVPMILTVPESTGICSRLEPSRYRAPVSQIDLVPTLLELIGEGPEDDLEGRSLVPRLFDNTKPDSDVFIEWNGMNSGFGDVLGDTKVEPEWLEISDEFTIKAALDDPVRTIVTPDGWKYTWSHRGEDMLFHLPTDPAELRNIVSATDKGFVLELRSRIERWQVETLDPVVFG